MNVGTLENDSAQAPSTIDIARFIEPGASERVLGAGSALAALWREEILASAARGQPTAQYQSDEKPTPLQLQIIEMRNKIRHDDLAHDIKPTPSTLTALRESKRFEGERLKFVRSLDPDVQNNFRTYTLDRIAFMAAWLSLHTGDGVQ